MDNKYQGLNVPCNVLRAPKNRKIFKTIIFT